MITFKQINYITFLLRSELPAVYELIPKYNSKHQRKETIFGVVNYRDMILKDIIDNYSSSSVQTLITLIQKQDEPAVKDFLFGIANSILKKYNK